MIKGLSYLTKTQIKQYSIQLGSTHRPISVTFTTEKEMGIVK